jgi:hypothetical protein
MPNSPPVIEADAMLVTEPPGDNLTPSPETSAMLPKICHHSSLDADKAAAIVADRSTASAALILPQAIPDLPANRVFEEVLRADPQAWRNLLMLEIRGHDVEPYG